MKASGTIDLYQPVRPGPVTFSLLIIFGVIWALVVLGVLDLSTPDLLLQAQEVWSGNPSSLLLSAFVHAEWYHFVLNAVGLLFFGGLAEKSLGSTRTALIFVVSAAYGNTLSLLLSPDPTIPSLGASGGMMGLLGAHVTAQILVHPKPRSLFSHRGNRVTSMALIGLLVIEALALAVPPLQSRINHAAHFGGLIGGVALAALMVPVQPKMKSMGILLKTVISIALLETALYGAYPVASPTFNETLAYKALDEANYQTATKLALQALRLEKNRPGSALILAESQEAAGELDDAEFQLRQAEKFSLNGSVTVRLAEFLHKHEREGAQEAFTTAEEQLIAQIKALGSETSQLAALARAQLKNNLAWLYASCDRQLQDGRSLAQNALRTLRSDPATLGTLGVIEYKLDDFELAAEHLDEAVNLHVSPRYRAHDLYYLSMALTRCHRLEEARRALDSAIAIDPLAPHRSDAENVVNSQNREAQS